MRIKKFTDPLLLKISFDGKCHKELNKLIISFTSNEPDILLRSFCSN